MIPASREEQKKTPKTSWLDDDKFLDSFKRNKSQPAPSWAFKTPDILKEMESVPLFMTQQPSEENDNNNYIEALQSSALRRNPE